jgi:hypothetical protein
MCRENSEDTLVFRRSLKYLSMRVQREKEREKYLKFQLLKASKLVSSFFNNKVSLLLLKTHDFYQISMNEKISWSQRTHQHQSFKFTFEVLLKVVSTFLMDTWPWNTANLCSNFSFWKPNRYPSIETKLASSFMHSFVTHVRCQWKLKAK